MADGALIDINRFPVKSLSVDRLTEARLETGAGLPADRRFAFAKIGTQPNPFQPEWRPKAAFHVMVTEPRMAAIKLWPAKVTSRIFGMIPTAMPAR